MSLPLSKGQEIEIEVLDLGDGGEGIGRIDGFTVFVKGGIPGDIVKSYIMKVKKSYAIGSLIEVIKPSENRVEAPCPDFFRCGGCQTQTISYKEQLKIKEDTVKSALDRIGGFKYYDIEPIIGMDEPYNYRNKSQYPVEHSKKGIKVGYYKRNSHDVVDIKSCMLQKTDNDLIMDIVRKFLTEFKIPVYVEKSHKGLVRHLMIRNSYSSGNIMVVLVMNGKKLPNQEILIARLLESGLRIASVMINVNKEKTNRILGRKNVTIYGDEKIVDKIGDLSFEISPLSFFQINNVQAEKLYDKALEYADLQGEEKVFDLYSGIGTISLALAKKAKEVIGVEVVEDAVEDAIKNAEINGVKNVKFHVGKAEEVIPELYAKGIKADVVVVDPPRKGCEEELLKTIIEMKPKKVVYVSCKPSTLARDLKILCENGFKLVKVQPVDMFPQTTHVECVAVLKRG